jgi:DNA-binding LacI/PurR family transcriptional regulator
MMPDEPWIAPVRQRGIPIVSNAPELGPAVDSDRAGMVRQAVAALAAQGRRRVGLLSWGTVQPLGLTEESEPSLVRVFRGAMADHGLQTRPGWICQTAQPSMPGAGWEAFRDIWLASRDRPDALVITDDQLLPGVFEAFRDSRIPPSLLPALATHITEGNPYPLPESVVRLVYSPQDHAQAMARIVRAAITGQAPAERQTLIPHRLVMPARDGDTPVEAAPVAARHGRTSTRALQ